MGFGLHVGWAIEGAIGSEYKIDASYLSPNVNMASRLEAATKQFGTSILMSEDFARMLSPQVHLIVTRVFYSSDPSRADACKAGEARQSREVKAHGVSVGCISKARARTLASRLDVCSLCDVLGVSYRHMLVDRGLEADKANGDAGAAAGAPDRLRDCEGQQPADGALHLRRHPRARRSPRPLARPLAAGRSRRGRQPKPPQLDGVLGKQHQPWGRRRHSAAGGCRQRRGVVLAVSLQLGIQRPPRPRADLGRR